MEPTQTRQNTRSIPYTPTNESWLYNIYKNCQESQTMKSPTIYHYLSNVKSLKTFVRNIIAKYRLDVNNTVNSKYRSFRCKNIASNLCRLCNVRQSVKHICVLLECSFRNLERKRYVFLENVCR